MVVHLSIPLNAGTTFPYHLYCPHLLTQPIRSQHFLCAGIVLSALLSPQTQVSPGPIHFFVGSIFQALVTSPFPVMPRVFSPQRHQHPSFLRMLLSLHLVAREPTSLMPKLISQDNQSSSCFLPSLFLPILSVPPPSTDSASVDLIIPSDTLIRNGLPLSFPYSGNSEILPSLLSSSDSDLSTHLTVPSISP